MTAFLAVNAIAGILILRGSTHARLLTTVAQLPQIIDVKTSHFFYHLLCGIALGFRSQTGFVGFTSGVGGQFNDAVGGFQLDTQLVGHHLRAGLGSLCLVAQDEDWAGACPCRLTCA